MDRVLPSEGRGCWFDPNRARQDDMRNKGLQPGKVSNSWRECSDMLEVKFGHELVAGEVAQGY